jgi:tetratricopeptide (TPR) repeat protein
VIISRPMPVYHQASGSPPAPTLRPAPKVRSEEELQRRAAGNLAEQKRRIAAAAEEREARERADEAARERADKVAYELIMEEENKPKEGPEEKSAKKKKKKQGAVQSKDRKDSPLTFDGRAGPHSTEALPAMSKDDSHPTSNDGGSETSVSEQQQSCETAAAILREVGVLGRFAEHEVGDAYQKLQAVGVGHVSRRDWGRAAKVYRKAIAVRPDKGEAYITLGGVLYDSAHYVEAAQRFLAATERTPEGSDKWAAATSAAFEALRQTMGRSGKPEWWDDEGLKALSARVVKAAPNLEVANRMRAIVLSGLCSGAWEVGPRSATELRLAALHYERCAELSPATAWKAKLAGYAEWCLRQAPCKL